jgi:adenylate cyclase class 2
MKQVETEVKFRVANIGQLQNKLQTIGFHVVTPRTFERNVLYDTPDRKLRAQQAILRIRKYGDRWVVTHKCLPPDHDPQSRHKRRIETETAVDDGEAIGTIFTSLGYLPAFTYEKWRTELEDATGHCVIDETPIGIFAELEGPADWIDESAKKLGLDPAALMTLSYGRLFDQWKQETDREPASLTFAEIENQPVS